MNILENYLMDLQEDILEENKWKAMLKAGKLGASQLKRIKAFRGAADPLYVKQLMKSGNIHQAEKYLAKRGIVKSARAWLAGVEKGTQNLLQKAGAKTINKPHAQFIKTVGKGELVGKTLKDPILAHGMVDPGGRKASMHVATGLKKKQQALGTLIKRHEADEITQGKKMYKLYGRKKMIVPTGSTGHMSDVILKKEKELTDFGKKMYGGKKIGTKTLDKYRANNPLAKQLGKEHEYDFIKATNKEHAKHDKAVLNAIQDQYSSAKKQLKDFPVADRMVEFKKAIKDLKAKGVSRRNMKVAYRKLKDFFGV
jgi:DNA-directed RNA polymerase subunit H (RpoH/RPB5)